jgi:plasmid stabilization system protein ParE
VARAYILSPEAQRDIEAIRAYYLESAGAKVARYVLAEIAAGFRSLASSPGLGHFRDDLTDEPVKFWPVFSYLIVYDPALRPIGIARVLHASQDLMTMLQKSAPRM